MQILQQLFAFVVTILILVSIHEFGHFYVARRCGVKVLRFSIGFGTVLWRRVDKHGTEFAVAALPLGGYVKMLDEREAPVATEDRSRAFNNKSVWQRMAIVAAGPLANIILAIVLFWALLLQGERALVPVVGDVEPNSVAASAGFSSGLIILDVDGESTPSVAKLSQALLARLGQSGTITFTLGDPEFDLKYSVSAELSDWLKDAQDPDPIKGLGISLKLPDVTPVAAEVIPAGAAERAGIMAGDKLTAINGIAVKNPDDFVARVRASPEQTLSVDIERSGQSIAIELTPELVTENGAAVGKVGLSVTTGKIPDNLLKTYHYSPLEALMAAVGKTWDTAGTILISVKKLILGEISTKNLSGPISIAKVAGSSAQLGFTSFVVFLATISVFLAVFNLLPIPVLDGGHLFYCLIEVIRGKPLSERVQMLGYQVGLFFVVSLSLLAIYNDIARVG